MLIALFMLPRADFGQREHFMVIFTLPYIVLALRRIEKQPCNTIAALAIGAFATLGFGLKPYFLLIPAVVEVYLLTQLRRVATPFRPETIALGIGLLAYIGAIFLFTPEYFSKIILYALEVYNLAYSSPFISVFFCLELFMILLLLRAVSLMRSDKENVPSSVYLLLIAGCASFVVYVVQMKGWSYHSYPARAFLFMSFGAFFVSWKNIGQKLSMQNLAIYAIGLGLFLLPIHSTIKAHYNSPITDTWPKEITDRGPVKSIFIMSAHVFTGFPLVNVMDVKWASRFPGLWLLPGTIRRREAAGNKPLPIINEIEQYNMNAVIEDLTKFKPEVIIVDVREPKPYFGGIPFDYIKYFSKDQRFKALWSHYAKTRHSKFGFDFYSLKK
jgi:hypothetical protein